MIDKAQEVESRKILLQFISQLKELHHFDEKKIFLAGFSQGAIMSYSIGLTHPEVVHGIAAMSGRILEEVKPIVSKSDRLQNLAVFISHGKKDNVLYVDYARSARVFLKGFGLEPSYHEYEEGHAVNSETMNNLVDWLKKN